MLVSCEALDTVRHDPPMNTDLDVDAESILADIERLDPGVQVPVGYRISRIVFLQRETP